MADAAEFDADAVRRGSNAVFARELSAYRFIGTQIPEITSEEEVGAIEEAMRDSRSPVTTHLQTALARLADRKSPDYRNSIKESISAVEAVVTEVNGSKASLGEALKKAGLDMHPAFKSALEKLYGYTSDANGIRHALLEESNLDADDAKFMLVASSAFVNYIRAKHGSNT